MASPVTYNNKFWYGHHVRMIDFETTKKMYEETRPLQGARKTHGIDQRPLSVRRRTWECWHKDDKGNYGMAFRQSYKQYSQDPNTKKSVVTGYHDSAHPFLMLSPKGELTFSPKWMNSYTTWEMLSALLPEGIKFCKYGAKQYFRVAQPNGEVDKYFLITGLNMSFVPYESEGKRYFMPLAGVTQEEKFLIDRVQAKKVREEFTAFLAYFQPMADLLGVDAKEISWSDKREAGDYLDCNNWLMRKDGEEYGEKWINGIEALLKAHARTQHHWVEKADGSGHEHHWTHHLPTADTLRHTYRNNEMLYRMVRPYKREFVPIGTPFMSNGRG